MHPNMFKGFDDEKEIRKLEKYNGHLINLLQRVHLKQIELFDVDENYENDEIITIKVDKDVLEEIFNKAWFGFNIEHKDIIFKFKD